MAAWCLVIAVVQGLVAYKKKCPTTVHIGAYYDVPLLGYDEILLILWMSL